MELEEVYTVSLIVTKSTKCSLFQTARELSVNKIDLGALTLVGPNIPNKTNHTITNSTTKIQLGRGTQLTYPLIHVWI